MRERDPISWGWNGARESGTQATSLQWVTETTAGAVTAASQHARWRQVEGRSQSLDLNPGSLIWVVGILTSWLKVCSPSIF